jgi:putative ABC transport system permease protein
MLNDLRFAIRSLRRNPAFAAVAILTLALGIGANTALFSVADAVLLKPLPYPQPERIVRIEGAPFGFTKTGMTTAGVMEESRVFTGVGMYADGGLNVGKETGAERVRAAAVSAGFFEAMGTQPIIGRPFIREEATDNARVAVIGYGLWRRYLGASRSLDRGIQLNGQTYTIVGVMPPRYRFPQDAEVWIPPGVDHQITGSAFAPSTIARLAPGVTPAQAAAEVERINDARRKGAPRDPRELAVVVTLLEEELVGTIRPLFAVIAAAVLLVLLVACMNTANLMLARVSARDREMAVRRAIGASGGQLVRYVLCESAVIALLAGLVAVPAAFWTLGALRVLLPASLHGVQDIAIDGRAALATAALCGIATLFFGVAPALSARRRQAIDALRTGTTTASPFWRRFRGGLVAAELASAVVLLAGAAMIVQTVSSLLAVDLGARGERVLTFQLTPPRTHYPTAREASVLFGRLQAELLNGDVEAVAASSVMPGTTETGIGTRVSVEGLPRPEGDDRTASYIKASPDYFRALGIDVVAGRAFTETDRRDAPLVAIVNERIAAALGLSPGEILGRRIDVGLGSKPAMATIVGVVRPVRLRGPERGAYAQMYVPYDQSGVFGTMYIAVQSRGDARDLAAAVRAGVQRVDPGLPPYNVRTFDEIRTAYIADRRFAMAVMTAFASLATALAAIGLYGVMGYLVQLRFREIGIRVALGATPGRVLRGTMKGGLSYAVLGILVGAASAGALSRLFISKVPGLEPVELSTLALIASVMLTIATATIWVPARRAARIDPVEALRTEG